MIKYSIKPAITDTVTANVNGVPASSVAVDFFLRKHVVDKIREQVPDLIVMDLSMPGLDGWGVFRELKADQRTLEIPCMAVTAHADLDRGEALKTGFNAYVSKPFSSEVLLETVASLISSQNQMIEE